jgi:hypothetical protein
LFSGAFGAAALQGRYALRSRHTLECPSDLDVTKTVIDVIVTGLNFPLKGKSRPQARFIQAVFTSCGSAALYLGSVWNAFGHLETQAFGELSDGLPLLAAYERLEAALQVSLLADETSREHHAMKAVEALVVDYCKCMTSRTLVVASNLSALIGNAGALQHQIPLYTIQQPKRCRPRVTAAPPLVLIASYDAIQLHNMNCFLEYLVELEPSRQLGHQPTFRYM